MTNLKSSTNPVADLRLLAYDGQDPKRRMYRAGYEDYFNIMPRIVSNDIKPLVKVKTEISGLIMQNLADELRKANWLKTNGPFPNEFWRTIIAMESPLYHGIGDNARLIQEGSEFIVAQWGDGFTSPVHGHAEGFMYEDILFGKMLVNTYRLMDDKVHVRLAKTEIITKGTFVSQYGELQGRQNLIHNFRSIGYSASLHFIPEHTRDGRGNGFEVEKFGDSVDLEDITWTELTPQDGVTKLQIGDVALVRSSNVAEYGDHYILITGSPVLKEHGLRPQDIAFEAQSYSESTVLDGYEPIQGLTLLKMDNFHAAMFRTFHGAQLIGGKSIML